MTDDLEPRLRNGLRGTDLPGAPATLHAFLIDLPTTSREPIAGARQFRAPRLFAAGLAVIVVAFAAGLLMTGSFGPAAGTSPTASANREAASSASPPAASPGVFVAPGIRLDLPVGWSDQTSAIEYPAIVGSRYVGFLARDMKFCPIRPYSTAPPTPKPTACDEQANQPGSATVAIIEFTRPFPWTHPVGSATTYGPYMAWDPPSSPASQPEWAIQSPDGALYLLTLTAPDGEFEARKADVRTMLESIQLSAWEPAPEVVDGHVHVDSLRGFSFDYPAGWTIYYPMGVSITGTVVVTVASAPLLPPCAGDTCQRFSTPPGTVAVEFEVGSGPTPLDWSRATMTIGGQPALGPENWGPQNATGADEGHTWTARLADPSDLTIYASLRGPGLPELRAAMNSVLSSIGITR